MEINFAPRQIGEIVIDNLNRMIIQPRIKNRVPVLIRRSVHLLIPGAVVDNRLLKEAIAEDGYAHDLATLADSLFRIKNDPRSLNLQSTLFATKILKIKSVHNSFILVPQPS